MEKRTRVVFFFFLAWFAIITLRLGYLASGMSGKYRISSEMVSGRSYPLPALRGTIFSSDNRKLAWSEKHYDLVLVSTITQNERESLQNILRSRSISLHPEIGYTIESLSFDELAALEKTVRNTPALHIKSRMLRVAVNDAVIQEKIGRIDPASGKALSGWELEYDAVLRGTDGSFHVTRDRKGRWLPNTGSIKVMPLPGRNVHVPLKYDDICGEKK